MSTREKFVASMKERLDEWNDAIDSLERRVDAAEESAKARYHERLAELKRQRARAQDRLDEVERASARTWEALKNDTESAWNDLQRGLTETKQSLSEVLGSSSTKGG